MLHGDFVHGHCSPHSTPIVHAMIMLVLAIKFARLVETHGAVWIARTTGPAITAQTLQYQQRQ